MLESWFCHFSACHGERGFCPASLQPEEGEDSQVMCPGPSLGLCQLAGQLCWRGQGQWEQEARCCGDVVPNQVLSPGEQEANLHRNLRYLFAVLHRKGSWVAKPQRHHKDYQKFSLFIYFSKQRHQCSLATSYPVLLLISIMSSIGS